MNPTTPSLKSPISTQTSRNARLTRWELLLKRFPDLKDMTVVDLGGTRSFWGAGLAQPAKLVLANPYEDGNLEADACDPDLLAGEHFDLAFSNSVIEHVGGHWRRTRFAENVHRLADHHFVQTPYRFFPIEPHWLFPGFQFLPLALQRNAMRRWPIGNYTDPRSEEQATEDALAVELQSKASIGRYFPDSRIEFEMWHGLPKSLIVTDQGANPQPFEWRQRRRPDPASGRV
jgi:hypothetical protein